MRQDFQLDLIRLLIELLADPLEEHGRADGPEQVLELPEKIPLRLIVTWREGKSRTNLASPGERTRCEVRAHHGDQH